MLLKLHFLLILFNYSFYAFPWTIGQLKTICILLNNICECLQHSQPNYLQTWLMPAGFTTTFHQVCRLMRLEMQKYFKILLKCYEGIKAFTALKQRGGGMTNF